MKIASQIQNAYPWPGTVALSGKTQGVSLTREGRETRKEGREHEAETQRVKRQTADSRGLRREQKRKEGGKEGGRGGGRGEGSAIKRGGIQGAHEGGKGSGPFPTRTQEGEKKGSIGGNGTASERAGKREQRLQRR